MRITVAAHAKINLDLRVLHRRPDGYHELRTVFQELDLHDRVTVEPTRGPFELAGDAAHMPLDATNLAWQAAAQLWRAAGRPGPPRGARVTIRKRIPSSAGLGGGSSDAAATLLALDRLWRTRLGLAGLQRAAASVGADVAFFLTGGTALGLGRGEELYPLVDLPVMPVLLVLPSFGVATGEAYGWLAEDRVAGASHAREGVRPARTRGDRGAGAELPWRGALPAWGNDLEAAVEARRPAIRRIRLALDRQGARVARMSGSGSAVFGLFATEREARRAAGALAGRGWRLLVTRTRRRSPAARRRLAGR